MAMGGSAERPAYEFVDMHTRGEGAVATAFANQVAYCEAGGAPITARAPICVALSCRAAYLRASP